MKRTLEPELMEEAEQASAYARADFNEPHSRIVEIFGEEFPGVDITGYILDLGSGPGDVSFRFAERFPRASIIGVDGSAAMIELAETAKAQKGGAAARVKFIKGIIAPRSVTPPIPRLSYDLIFSTSFLHHLHEPSVLWDYINEYASTGTKIFVTDLLRPRSRKEASRLVELYSAGEPEVLKRDFYNSLLAAFRPVEVTKQLENAGLNGFTVKVVSDRHMIIFGEKG